MTQNEAWSAGKGRNGPLGEAPRGRQRWAEAEATKLSNWHMMRSSAVSLQSYRGNITLTFGWNFSPRHRKPAAHRDVAHGTPVPLPLNSWVSQEKDWGKLPDLVPAFWLATKGATVVFLEDWKIFIYCLFCTRECFPIC